MFPFYQICKRTRFLLLSWLSILMVKQHQSKSSNNLKSKQNFQGISMSILLCKNFPDVRLYFSFQFFVFLNMLGATSFSTRQEVYEKRTENFVLSWERGRTQKDWKYAFRSTHVYLMSKCCKVSPSTNRLWWESKKYIEWIKLTAG